MSIGYLNAPQQTDEADQAARAVSAVADLFEFTVGVTPVEVFSLAYEPVVDGGADAIVLSLQHQPLGGAYAEKATLTVPSTYAAGEFYYNGSFQAFAANLGDKVKVRVTDAGAATSTGRVFVGYRRSPKAKPTVATFKEVTV